LVNIGDDPTWGRPIDRYVADERNGACLQLGPARAAPRRSPSR